MLFGRPIRVCLPIFLLLIPTFSSMHSTGFCLSHLFVCCFVDSRVLSTNSWCLALSKMFETWRCQIGTIICDECSWNFESTYEVFPNELGNIFVFDTSIDFCLHPLVEVVDCNEQKLLLCCSSGKETDYVHPPLHKRPRTCDWVEGFRRYMENGSV